MKGDEINCQHENWVCAWYPYEKICYGEGTIKISSIYEVYCKDCNNFVNLLSGETINNKGLLKMGENNG